MAYITKEEAQKCLDDLSNENLIGNENDTFISLAEAKDRIEELPTADVAPRAEVDKWQCRCAEWHSVAELKSQQSEKLVQDVTRLEQENETLKDSNEHLAVLLSESKTEVAREIFEEIEKLTHSLETPINKYWVLLPNELAELKKKYTELTP